MPLYEFKCESCGTVFEELVPTNIQKADCPCGNGQGVRENLFEQTAKPTIKGDSVDGTGRSYIQDGDYMVGYRASSAWSKMDERDNYKRRVMFKHKTTSLSRRDYTETEKTYTGKTREHKLTKYEPLVGEALQNFISQHRKAQGYAKEGRVKSEDI